MIEFIARFFVGGLVVSVFALIGDLLKPKSFAGLFSAAPSVALATVGLTLGIKGASYVATEARSMIAGSVAFFVYASAVSWILMRRRPKTLWVTISALPLWFGVALGVWVFWLR